MPKAELDWPTRIGLRSDLARWLQTFIESEAMGQYQDHDVEHLLRLTGSKAKEFSNFKTSLKRALDELQACSAIVRYEFITARVVRIYVVVEDEYMDS